MFTAELGERLEVLSEITWAGLVEVLIYFPCISQRYLTRNVIYIGLTNV